ncbi:MAG TPA: hypothetical protein VMT79_04075 [Candidatus Binatia bacterium]|nr:hypothetical protein [Candidatus Binatia bacterium]
MRVTEIAAGLPGRNYSGYYHYPTLTGEGEWLVIRNMRASAEYGERMRSLTYYAVRVPDGETIQLTGNGFANIASVNRRFVYVLRKRRLADPTYTVISRLGLDTLEREDLYYTHDYPGGPGLTNLVVNATGSALLFSEGRRPDPRRLPSVDIKILDLARREPPRLLVAGARHYNHWLVHPTRPDLMAYVDQSAGASIRRIGMANIDTLERGPLQAIDAFTACEQTLAHPVFTADGRLWVDSLFRRGRGCDVSRFLVALDVNAYQPWLESAEVARLAPAGWNMHLNATRSIHWFVGDGDPRQPGRPAGFGIGEPYIQAVFVSPDLRWIRAIRLAPVADPIDPHDADTQPQARATADLGRAIWSNGGRVFMAEVPASLQARMRRDELEADYGQVRGEVTGWSERDEQRVVAGWACALMHSAPLLVEIYAGARAGSPQAELIATGVARERTHGEESASCQTSDVGHGFEIEITSAAIEAHRGQPLFAHARSPVVGRPPRALAVAPDLVIE